VARTAEPRAGALCRARSSRPSPRSKAAGGRAVAIGADLADPDDRARIVPSVEADLGPVDILVHNAAAAIYAPTAEMPLRRRQVVFEVNVHAAMDLAQAVLPHMRAAKRGTIINLSSASSVLPAPPPATGVPPTMSVYGASKAASERLTVGLRGGGVRDDISVTTLAPVARRVDARRRSARRKVPRRPSGAGRAGRVAGRGGRRPRHLDPKAYTGRVLDWALPRRGRPQAELSGDGASRRLPRRMGRTYDALDDGLTASARAADVLRRDRAVERRDT
jgi:NAD(P)-dependent dehydrogenase (short-subunit alcohol dehydrogenase family)